MVKLLPDDSQALLTFKDGRKQREEFYYGASFLSQSARFLSVTRQVREVEIVNGRGQKRVINF